MEWFKKIFALQAQAYNTTGKAILFIDDGHHSHETIRLHQLVEKHKIHLFCLPAHTTHCLQPLDIGVFGPLQCTWQHVCASYLEQHRVEMMKKSVIEEYIKIQNMYLKKRQFFRPGDDVEFNPLTQEYLQKRTTHQVMRHPSTCMSLPPFLDNQPLRQVMILPQNLIISHLKQKRVKTLKVRKRWEGRKTMKVKAAERFEDTVWTMCLNNHHMVIHVCLVMCIPFPQTAPWALPLPIHWHLWCLHQKTWARSYLTISDLLTISKLFNQLNITAFLVDEAKCSSTPSSVNLMEQSTTESTFLRHSLCCSVSHLSSSSRSPTLSLLFPLCSQPTLQMSFELENTYAHIEQLERQNQHLQDLSETAETHCYFALKTIGDLRQQLHDKREPCTQSTRKLNSQSHILTSDEGWAELHVLEAQVEEAQMQKEE